MADDEFHLGSGNWWDTARNRFDGGGTMAAASVPTTLNVIASFGWPSEMVDMKSRSSNIVDSATASDGGSTVLRGCHHQSSAAAGGGVSANPNLQIMGLGLSSQSLDWNQPLLRGEKSESSFRSFLQEDLSSNCNTYQPESGAAPSSQEHWRQRLCSRASSDDSSVRDFNQINRGFSLDQLQYSSSQANSNDSTISSQNLTTSGFQVADSTAAYGLLLPENNQHHHPVDYQNRSLNYPYSSSGYGANDAVEFIPSLSKYPPLLRTSQPPQPEAGGGSHLHFTNNTPFWNASAPAATMTGTSSSFFPALQTHQIPAAPLFGEKSKNTSEGRHLGATAKRNNTDTSNKRSRSETTPSTLPAFKVRKEKMGDRITALQQLVSPFGKTDTASVLSEAIEYIKFLHEQLTVLSSPYMKNGAPIQNQQNYDKSKDSEGPRRDLRSRGLGLVPVSSTFPMTHETAGDFWTPTFGETFR